MSRLPPPVVAAASLAAAGPVVVVAAGVPRPGGVGSGLDLSGGGRGRDGGTAYLAVGGAGALAPGAATLFASVRRRAAHGARPGR